MAMRRGLFRVVPLLQAMLENITLPFSAVRLKDFVSACAKNDEVASVVTRAIEQVDVDGIITVQDSQRRDTVLNLWDGVRYDYGLYHTAFITEPVRKTAVLTNPFVLLSDEKINSIQDIRKILEEVIRLDASLLIITRDLGDDLQKILPANAARGLKIVVARAPGFGDTRRRNMLALAAKTGSLLFGENTAFLYAELTECSGLPLQILVFCGYPCVRVDH